MTIPVPMTAHDILAIIEKGGALFPSIVRISVGTVTVYERGTK